MSSITILTDAFADNPLNAPLYALPYMLTNVTLSGMVTDVKPLHPWKAYSPIDVTLSGMVTDVKLLQPRKASYPIDMTLSGMVTDIKPLQFWYLEVIDYQLFVVNTVEKWIGCYLWVYGK